VEQVDRPYCEAAERNKVPVLEVLRSVFTKPGRVLEIGAGTGQHARHFAEHLPWLVWQPTERPEMLARTRAGTVDSGLPNLLPPVALDVSSEPWPVTGVRYIYSSNTAHIMGWTDVKRMFAQVASLLPADGVFCLYGPFNERGRFTSEGNARLDAWARSLDPEAGLRDLDALVELGSMVGLGLAERHKLPANNQLLVWRPR
jgi:cyclopropane fatty-acyl-phospholipid synthase-like methyltransferase